jgi:hypothetical protein
MSAATKSSSLKNDVPFTFLGIHFARYTIELAKTIDRVLAHKINPTDGSILAPESLYGFDPVESDPNWYQVLVPDNEHVQVFETNDGVRYLNVHCCQYGPQINCGSGDESFYSYSKRDTEAIKPKALKGFWGIKALPFVYLREKLQKWNIGLYDFNTTRRHADGTIEYKDGPMIELFFNPESVHEIGEYERAFHGFNKHPETLFATSDKELNDAKRDFLNEVTAELKDVIDYADEVTHNFQTVHYSELKDIRRSFTASSSSSSSSSSSRAPAIVKVDKDAPVRKNTSFANVLAKKPEEATAATPATIGESEVDVAIRAREKITGYKTEINELAAKVRQLTKALADCQTELAESKAENKILTSKYKKLLEAVLADD